MPGRTDAVNYRNFVAVQRYLTDGTTLDLGAGDAHPHAEGEGDVTLDIDPRTDPDMVYQVNRTLPFGDDQFDAVTAIHFLEHLDADMEVWAEMRRVASEVAVAVVPIGPRDDPDHVHEYGAAGALGRFDPDDREVCPTPTSNSGKVDLVLVAYTG